MHDLMKVRDSESAECLMLNVATTVRLGNDLRQHSKLVLRKCNFQRRPALLHNSRQLQVCSSAPQAGFNRILFEFA